MMYTILGKRKPGSETSDISLGVSAWRFSNLESGPFAERNSLTIRDSISGHKSMIKLMVINVFSPAEHLGPILG